MVNENIGESYQMATNNPRPSKMLLAVKMKMWRFLFTQYVFLPSYLMLRPSDLDKQSSFMFGVRQMMPEGCGSNLRRDVHHGEH